MAIRFAKMAPGIDGHPKIRRAGRAGREVFLFVLRRNADLDRSGRVPLTYVDPWYLADQLMMPEAEAIDGLARCVTAGLLRRAADHVSIIGWDDEWAKAPLDEAERKRRQREKDEASAQKPRRQRRQSRNVTTDAVTQSDRPDSHALEESRGEENRTEESREDCAPTSRPLLELVAQVGSIKSDHQSAIDEFHGYYQRTHGGSSPSWPPKNAKLISALLKEHGISVLRSRLRVLEATPPKFPPPPWDLPTFAQHFDKIANAHAPRSSTGRVEPKTPGEYPEGDIAL